MNRILIIDDDRSLLELLQNCMCGLYKVDTAWNGQQGILPKEEICFDKITIVPQIKGILKENKEVLLTGKEFDLLYFLASSPKRAYTKKQIYKAVWKNDYVYDDNNIMALVSKIRKKIEDDPENPRIIQTVRGVGYRFGGGQ